jgi:DNA-binding IclR family transcriptional regulator
MNQSVLKALAVLDAFTAEQDHLSAAQLGAATGVARGSLYPILYALEDRGYLQRGAVRAYGLGLRFVERANLLLRRMDIHETARPTLQHLASALHVNAHVGVLNGLAVVHLHREIGADAVVVGEIIGWQAPAYCTALGKVLLADLPSEELSRLLAASPLLPYTPATITSVPRLTQEIRHIADRGYAINDEEYHAGIVGIAAAVTDVAASACYAISISVTKPRFDREKDALIEDVRRAAHAISERLRTRQVSPVLHSEGSSLQHRQPDQKGRS